jgi:ABC-2 type transport system permease protein
MIIILIAIIVGVCGLSKAEQSVVQNQSQLPPMGNDWKQQLTTEDTAAQQSIDAMEKSKNQTDKNSIDSTKMQIAENKYRIDHNMKPDISGKQGFWDMEGGMGKIIALLAIIACAALVAGEFSEGTMKTMISRPYARWQILTAKFAAALIYTIILCVISFLTIMAATAIFFGTYGFNATKLLWISGNVLNVSAAAAAILQAGLDFLEVLVYLIIGFALSAIFRSRALATGVSIFLMFGGSFALFFGQYFSWGRLILFADTGFSTFIMSGAPFYGITLGLALLISAAYCAVFLFAGYFTFAKRDIS